MERVCQNKKDILQDTQVICLKERIHDGGVGFGKVGDEFEANSQAKIAYVAHSVFESPDNGIKKELELRSRDLKKS